MQSKIGFKMVKLTAFLLAAGLTAVVAVPKNPKIVGGSLTTVSQYPFAASLLYSYDLVNYYQSCGGTILTTKSVLSAGHCFYGDTANRWRIRVGSSWANTGGSVYNVSSIVIHPNFDYYNLYNDVAILRTANINYVTGSVQAASIAGANYLLADSQPVYAIGWGTTYVGGTGSEQLRHVQIWTVNQSVCQSRYSEIGWTVTTGMVCSGWLDVGGRDQCQGDSGGPLLHNNVVVGICSWGNQCALPRYPGVNTRVSNYTTWILANA